MNLTIDRDKLFKELTVAKKYLSKTVPGLSNFYFEANDASQQLKIVASDGNNGYEAILSAQVKTAGSSVINFEILYGTLRNLESGKAITLDVGATSAVLKERTTTVNIPIMPASAYSLIAPLVATDTLELTSDELKAIVNSTTFARIPKASGAQDFKFEGLHMSIENNVALFTCTDRKRIAFAKQTFLGGNPFTGEILMSVKPIEDFVSSLEDGKKVLLNINSTSKRISFESGNVKMYPALMQEAYPNMMKQVPKTLVKLTLNREAFINKLQIAALVSDDIELYAKNNQIELKAKGHGTGAFADNVSATVTNAMDITLRTRILLDGIQRMDSADIEICLLASDKPAIIKPKGSSSSSYLIMPVI